MAGGNATRFLIVFAEGAHLLARQESGSIASRSSTLHLLQICVRCWVSENSWHRNNLTLVGIWELAYPLLATPVVYAGLRSYRFIGIAWLMHFPWDLAHHFLGNPIWPFMPTSSFARSGIFSHRTKAVLIVAFDEGHGLG